MWHDVGYSLCHEWTESLQFKLIWSFKPANTILFWFILMAWCSLTFQDNNNKMYLESGNYWSNLKNKNVVIRQYLYLMSIGDFRSLLVECWRCRHIFESIFMMSGRCEVFISNSWALVGLSEVCWGVISLRQEPIVIGFGSEWCDYRERMNVGGRKVKGLF